MNPENDKKYIQLLPANRVRRNYKGGAMLEALEGKSVPDDNRPEDWIASTTAAKNPGMPEIPGEGLAWLSGENGTPVFLKDLFEKYPEHYLGLKHYEKLGANLGFLVKLLDSSMRLHVQAHPTAQFAQQHLNSRWGKLETYVILGSRAGVAPYLRLGFQRPPSPEEWKRIVLEQDIKAMDKCFDKIPVKEGEVWVVPGGLPHAIGEGLLVVEIMEPTDLVVRCEFEREGIIVPPPARFMGKDPDFALKIFDYAPMTFEKLYDRCRISPRIIRQEKGFVQERLIGNMQTDCFNVSRVKISHSSVLELPPCIHIGIVTKGSGKIISNREVIPCRKGSKFLVAAAAGRIEIHPENDTDLELVLCLPSSPEGFIS